MLLSLRVVVDLSRGICWVCRRCLVAYTSVVGCRGSTSASLLASAGFCRCRPDDPLRRIITLLVSPSLSYTCAVAFVD
ncbi:hypothetical protein GW17_00012191 [Ensete ventricosum]|nr:hypothetical protein GW17_00012191 [Ensete ventricosum]